MKTAAEYTRIVQSTDYKRCFNTGSPYYFRLDVKLKHIYSEKCRLRSAVIFYGTSEVSRSRDFRKLHVVERGRVFRPLEQKLSEKKNEIKFYALAKSALVFPGKQSLFGFTEMSVV